LPDVAVQRVFAGFDVEDVPPTSKSQRTGSFTDNMKLPIHRWFRYSAGFSAEWTKSVIRSAELGPNAIVFDPFAGSGTTLLAAEQLGVASAGVEAHPFVYRVAKAKLAWNIDAAELIARAEAMLDRARGWNAPYEASSGTLLQKCYTPQALARLDALRHAYIERAVDGDPIDDLLWLGITAILRECSGVGTAQWQYILPNKTKAKITDPFIAFTARIAMFAADIRHSATQSLGGRTEIRHADARQVSMFAHLHDAVDLVITSPPYPNNYDYADATRLEMTFWREIDRWGDLQLAVRSSLIRSCSQHSAAERLMLNSLLEQDVIAPIRDELSAACRELQILRGTRLGKKSYDTMVAAYFVDLAKVWIDLRTLCKSGSKVCFVVGDSAPYGVHIPVERWLSQLAVAAGFNTPDFEKIRDRNTKWKNRKHRVPLLEGNLWLRG
jgi:hypothetical protein